MTTDIELVQTALTQFDAVSAGLATLNQQYAGMLFDVATTKGLDDAKAARLAIRQPRFEVEAIRKSAKAPLIAIGKKLDAEAARITAELLKIEAPIEAQIKAEESRKEREREARVQQELKRVAYIHEAIAEIRAHVTTCGSSTSAVIANHIEQVEGYEIGKQFEEFTAQAEDAKTATLARLRELHQGALDREAEAERIKAERAELAKLRADQEERTKADRARLAEEEAAAKVIRDQEAAVQAEAARQEREENARQRQAHEAEAKRLADERAELDRREAAQRAADQARIDARKKRKAIPTAAQMVEAIAAHFQVKDSVAREWLSLTDFKMKETA